MLPEKQKVVCFHKTRFPLSKEPKIMILTFVLELLSTVTSTIIQEHIMLVMM